MAGASQVAAKLADAKAEKQRAIDDEDFDAAKRLKKEIEELEKELKALQSAQQSGCRKNASAIQERLRAAEAAYKKAIEDEDFDAAKQLKQDIAELRAQLQDDGRQSKEALRSQLQTAEVAKKKAIEDEDFDAAKKLKEEIASLQKQLEATALVPTPPSAPNPGRPRPDARASAVALNDGHNGGGHFGGAGEKAAEGAVAGSASRAVQHLKSTSLADLVEKAADGAATEEDKANAASQIANMARFSQITPKEVLATSALGKLLELICDDSDRVKEVAVVALLNFAVMDPSLAGKIGEEQMLRRILELLTCKSDAVKCNTAGLLRALTSAGNTGKDISKAILQTKDGLSRIVGAMENAASTDQQSIREAGAGVLQNVAIDGEASAKEEILNLCPLADILGDMVKKGETKEKISAADLLRTLCAQSPLNKLAIATKEEGLVTAVLSMSKRAETPAERKAAQAVLDSLSNSPDVEKLVDQIRFKALPETDGQIILQNSFASENFDSLDAYRKAAKKAGHKFVPLLPLTVADYTWFEKWEEQLAEANAVLVIDSEQYRKKIELHPGAPCLKEANAIIEKYEKTDGKFRIFALNPANKDHSDGAFQLALEGRSREVNRDGWMKFIKSCQEQHATRWLQLSACSSGSKDDAGFYSKLRDLAEKDVESNAANSFHLCSGSLQDFGEWNDDLQKARGVIVVFSASYKAELSRSPPLQKQAKAILTTLEDRKYNFPIYAFDPEHIGAADAYIKARDDSQKGYELDGFQTFVKKLCDEQSDQTDAEMKAKELQKGLEDTGVQDMLTSYPELRFDDAKKEHILAWFKKNMVGHLRDIKGHDMHIANLLRELGLTAQAPARKKVEEYIATLL
eukprot:TRINITY_DN28684_c0_g1_i1.p1 TRINITY_DN28684_c0_g1~~TRINITY_DN28684_c0_g1_i1.p1  ORF type:complete len:860 (+),score=251.38 TRINITY_DN28684_c0_g1_i1:173-2752(+)